MKPLTRYFAEWRDEEYWYKEKDIKEAVEWLRNKVDDSKIKVLISRAFPEVWFSKEMKK